MTARLHRCARRRIRRFHDWIAQVERPAPAFPRAWFCASLEAGYHPGEDAPRMDALVAEARQLLNRADA